MVAGARTLGIEETFLPANILDPPPTRHALLTILIALAAVLHIGTAAWGDLYDGVEGQIAGGAREMVSSGQWLMPTNNGVPQLRTPPLTCWAVAISYKIFGISATAARVPIALAMISSVALTFLIGERLAGYWRGFAAGLIHLCSAGTFVLGRLVAPDNLFCLFVVAALYCAVCGYQRQKFRRLWFACFWLSAALATLAKGPGAVLFLAGILVVLSILFREAQLRFALLLHWTNLLLFVVIAAPWFVWAQKHFPGFATYFVSAPNEPGQARWRFILLLFGCWFPGLFLVLPGLIFGARKIFRPNEFGFADALPICWIAAGLLSQLFASTRHLSAAVIIGPGFALLAACAWERSTRGLRAMGVALGLVFGLVVASVIWFGSASVDALLARSLSDAAWFSLRPLAQIVIGALIVSALGAFALVRQRGEVMLVLALVAMVPAGFCLIEGGARAGPFLSLADAAQYLNPRLGRTGEVIYEGPLRSGNSLSFYLDKKFYLVNQKPAAFERDPVALGQYLDEPFVLEAWDRSDPLYMIIDESRVSYWRERIVQRVHIFHQVTTCGRRVVLSNQL
jgi:4-amino-4-deoxy-L-arabinose transferase-like glycosyltransferase